MVPATRHSPEQLDVLVVGAGLSGLYAAHRLAATALRFTVVEMGEDVGGTWYWNRYPGCRCDIESIDYSYSFDPDLDQDWLWTERFATQPEILRYINYVADRYDLRRHIRLNTKVESMTFDERTARWEVETSGGRYSAAFCILATGPLSVPITPDLPGADTFSGDTYHTGLWPKQGVDLAGKNVGVIGTGSSGVQIIPAIAPLVENLFVFQRTPTCIGPASNSYWGAERMRALKSDYPARRQAARESAFLRSDDLVLGAQSPPVPAAEMTPAERDERLERFWNENGPGFFLAFADVFTDADANEYVVEFFRRKIRQIVRDLATAEKLCPPPGQLFGTKRYVICDGYYETYNRPNVTLIDVREDPILKVVPHGITTTKREIDLDVIVYATGFDAVTGSFFAAEVSGRGGRNLREAFASSPDALFGVATHDFPNLFFMHGPRSPSVLAAMVTNAEFTVNWIVEAIEHVRERGAATIEATKEAQDAWVAHSDGVAAATLFPRTDSWYTGANVDGKPHFFMVYIGGWADYTNRCETAAANGYEGFVVT